MSFNFLPNPATKTKLDLMQSVTPDPKKFEDMHLMKQNADPTPEETAAPQRVNSLPKPPSYLTVSKDDDNDETHCKAITDKTTCNDDKKCEFKDNKCQVKKGWSTMTWALVIGGSVMVVVLVVLPFLRKYMKKRASKAAASKSSSAKK